MATLFQSSFTILICKTQNTETASKGLDRIVELFYVLVWPFGAIAFGTLWYLIFQGTAIQGAWGSCESLGESLMYIAAYAYWKRQTETA